jgi:signal transduction histidine kinase
VDALAWLADDLLKRYGLQVTTASTGEPVPLNDALAGFVFRAVRELLMNVQQHAETSTANVLLRWSPDELEIEVRDQGVGFDADGENEAAPTGVGLFGVRERLGRLGGSVRVESEPGRGTRVFLIVPLARDAGR